MSSKSASRLSVLCLSGALACAALTGDAEEVVLPLGDARPAIISRHFPDRTHEFVWRNWARWNRTSWQPFSARPETDVTAIAVSMGLPADISIAPEMRQRGYVTLIRRNWHLLPYEQLLELLEITPQQLDIMLREEDFLWVKLGRAKPSCEVLRYQPPDDASQQRAGGNPSRGETGVRRHRGSARRTALRFRTETRRTARGPAADRRQRT